MPTFRTPFYEHHLKAGARMVEFAGWEMPLLYKGILEEHEHTRTAASLFDVSHMGRVRFTGKEATRFLNGLLTRNLEKVPVHRSAYSLACNESGGVLDDLIVSRLNPEGTQWLMVCNASNREKLLAHFRAHLARTRANVKIEDETFSTSMVAVQGPKVMALLDGLLPEPVSGLKRYEFMTQRYMMIVSFHVFRSGYTGEDGVEIIVGNTAALLAVKFLLGEPPETAVLRPAGLGARDTLRMEAGMPLYGHELTEAIDPLSAGLPWAVDLTKDFVGAEALRKIAAAGPRRKLVGLLIEGPRAARQGMAVLQNGAAVGTVTSGAFAPTLKRPIAMAYVNAELSAPGTALAVDLRGTPTPAVITPLPFYKRAN